MLDIRGDPEMDPEDRDTSSNLDTDLEDDHDTDIIDPGGPDVPEEDTLIAGLDQSLSLGEDQGTEVLEETLDTTIGLAQGPTDLVPDPSQTGKTKRKRGRPRKCSTIVPPVKLARNDRFWKKWGLAKANRKLNYSCRMETEFSRNPAI